MPLQQHYLIPNRVLFNAIWQFRQQFDLGRCIYFYRYCDLQGRRRAAVIVETSALDRFFRRHYSALVPIPAFGHSVTELVTPLF